MDANFRFLGLAGAVTVLGGLATLAGCTTDEGDTGAAGAAGAGGTAGAAGSGGSSTGGASTTGTGCASIDAAKPGIATFDTYDGIAALRMWSFPLGSDMANGVTAGTFGYGDQDGFPETFEMALGHDSTYALRVADMLAEGYGGGEGLWLSACVNATKFAGVSFWARGNSPSGVATFTLSMTETLPTVPENADGAVGTCAGDIMTCVHPKFEFTLTDTWTKIEIPWSSFTAGSAVGTAVKPDGRNIKQIQFAVGLIWVADAAGVYAPTPAPYELAVDTLAFY